ncbi:MAG: ACT domain-containing protein [Oscillospiraceae bacterium]|jgi:chorismate mutase|nr:ACT domain-containing protein [Oscillospiraceae bacterium]MBQ7958356.1 ACT domain-containing protein [Oscillospiraceae bacterium]MBR6696599.1 ACT domain-containing protein [Oscillospiraceae bacterium]
MPKETEGKSSFIVVDSCVLPDIFEKVLLVKKLIASGKEKSSASACKAVGISRSAFYKYKDYVYSYEEKLTQRIISISTVLHDEPGILAGFISHLHSLNANILTVNQSIPVDGVASVTISLRLTENSQDIMGLKNILSRLRGVVELKIISGE